MLSSNLIETIVIHLKKHIPVLAHFQNNISFFFTQNILMRVEHSCSVSIHHFSFQVCDS